MAKKLTGACYNLFLDKNVKPPEDKHWRIIRSHNQFVDLVVERYMDGKLPDNISLGDNEMSITTLSWYIEFAINSDLPFPKFIIHAKNKDYVKKLKETLGNLHSQSCYYKLLNDPN